MQAFLPSKRAAIDAAQSPSAATHLPDYVELHAVSNFSFQIGASHPHELIERALALGYRGLALTDVCSMAGVVRAHLALRQARQSGVPGAQDFQLILGSSFEVQDDLTAQTSFTLVVLACHRRGYGLLCEFISRLRQDGEGKTLRPLLRQAIVPKALADCLLILCPHKDTPHQVLRQQIAWLRRGFHRRAWLGLEVQRDLDDRLWTHTMRGLAHASGLPLLACGDVRMHVRSRQPLQDVLTAIRLGQALSACGTQLARHAEHHLRSRLQLARLMPADALAQTCHVASLCPFSLDELRYAYPEEVVPAGWTPSAYLRRLTYDGASWRYPQGIPASVQDLIEKELGLISELSYEKYFLTVYDIVRFARERAILCQGRGSAANSAVCFCLGITEVDPSRSTLLFERFISKERNEPPDIDVDFEHERREEVIQYLYRKYGRDRAALTATVITYRSRSALRDVGKALGFDLACVDRICASQGFSRGRSKDDQDWIALGLDPQQRRVRLWLELSATLTGFPRHLGQHTGGFVISQGPLCRMVPIENASMAERSLIQWDKDDLDALGLLKVDVLALGMLTALRKAMNLIAQQRGDTFEMQDIPKEDPLTYDMMCRADTVGVFQIESRAQMSMLPRLRPRCFYDLVVEVALVRPGPIQGGMVHPYLRRRQGLEANSCPAGLEAALGRTLGVPIFQEQVMQVAVIAAGFSPGEADALRRSMAAWRRKGGVHHFEQRLIQGMLERGHPRSFAEQICKQIEGFGEYGFPESHAASFALLVYASAWIKCHEPAIFLCALLNAQPLGFYSPSQLVQDARRHGVQVLPADVMHSQWDAQLEPSTSPSPQGASAVRLGLRLIQGLGPAIVERLLDARREAPFRDIEDLCQRAALDKDHIRALASADALHSLAGHRRQQVWEACAQQAASGLLKEASIQEAHLELPPPSEGEDIVFDYASLGLSLRRHPLALLRPRLERHQMLSAQDLHSRRNGNRVRTCGLVTVRQQPGTASGVVFVTLEDESGQVNVIVWPQVKQRQHKALTQARLLAVDGVWQRQGEVCHVIAHQLHDCSAWLGRLNTLSRDFR